MPRRSFCMFNNFWLRFTNGYGFKLVIDVAQEGLRDLVQPENHPVEKPMHVKSIMTQISPINVVWNLKKEERATSGVLLVV
ncbi:hypothetical protein TNCV_2041281 [Trichonephila clavipes]|nr:hypothetical protein TNCV_2041281 [Trichonephila clavipes]